jgi:hypothetical protein
VARIDEIIDGIYRISTTYSDGFGFQFNQFLIDDERPALIHTGIRDARRRPRRRRRGVGPGRLEYVILLHFEADECGAMDRFLEGAPGSALACSAASAQLNLSGWNYAGRVLGHEDGDVIDLGQHRLRQPGDQPPGVTENLGAEMCAFYREIGIFAHEDPVRHVVDRLERLDPDWIHGIHGGSLRRESIPNFARAAREAVRVRGQGARARAPDRDRSLTGWASAGSHDRFRSRLSTSLSTGCPDASLGRQANASAIFTDPLHAATIAVAAEVPLERLRHAVPPFPREANRAGSRGVGAWWPRRRRCVPPAARPRRGAARAAPPRAGRRPRS